MCHCFYSHCHSHSMCSFKSWPFLSVSSLCLCFCFGADCLSVCFSALSMSVCPYFSGCPCQCQTILYLRAAHLGSHHSHSSRQCCLCLTAPHQSDCSQLRQSPSVLLPLHWPNLTAGAQVRATSWPEYSDYTKTTALMCFRHYSYVL